MKIMGKYIVLAIAMLLLSCNKSLIQLSSGNGAAVQFKMTLGTISKTVTDSGDADSRTIAWRDNDAVGIFVNGSTNVKQYKYNSVKDFWRGATSDDIIYVQAENTYQFFAYYPYGSSTVSADGLSLTATVASDQNLVSGSNTGYDLSDVMIASTAELNWTSAADVSMTFSHVFSMAEVHVKGDMVTETPEYVKLCSVKPSANVNLTTGNVALDAAAEATEISMLLVGASEGGWLYRAIVPAQTIAKGKDILKIKLAGDTAIYGFAAPDSGVEYQRSKYLRMDANLNEKIHISFPSGTPVDSWGPSDGISNPYEGEKQADLVTIPISTLTSETMIQKVGNPLNEIYNPASSAFISETCWLMYAYKDESSLENDPSLEEDIRYNQVNQIAASITTVEGETWIHYTSEKMIPFGEFMSGIRYHHYETFSPGYYKLRMTARKTAGEATTLRIFMRTASTTENPNGNNGLYFVGPNSIYPGFQHVIFTGNTGNWETCELYFDCTKAVYSIWDENPEIHNVSGDTEAYDYFDLAIMPDNNGPMSFHIKDVQLIKITETDYNLYK